MVRRLLPSGVRCSESPVTDGPDDSRWCPYTEGMVSKDFKYEALHPDEEPFWILRSPNADEDTAFLVDSTALRKLHDQIGKELAEWDAHLSACSEPSPDATGGNGE